MSDGRKKADEQFENYKRLCEKLGVKTVSDWTDHYNDLMEEHGYQDHGVLKYVGKQDLYKKYPQYEDKYLELCRKWKENPWPIAKVSKWKEHLREMEDVNDEYDIYKYGYLELCRLKGEEPKGFNTKWQRHFSELKKEYGYRFKAKLEIKRNMEYKEYRK